MSYYGNSVNYNELPWKRVQISPAVPPRSQAPSNREIFNASLKSLKNLKLMRYVTFKTLCKMDYYAI